MSYHLLDDIVGLIRDEKPMWEGNIMELSDDARDAIACTWLQTHKTWADDVFPHTISDRYDFALAMLYGPYGSSGMMSQMLVEAAERNAKDVDNDAYVSDALDDFEHLLFKPGLLETMRDQIYLYCEGTLFEAVQDSYIDMIHQEKIDMGVH
jgi:hypothetical protein